MVRRNWSLSDIVDLPLASNINATERIVEPHKHAKIQNLKNTWKMLRRATGVYLKQNILRWVSLLGTNTSITDCNLNDPPESFRFVYKSCFNWQAQVSDRSILTNKRKAGDTHKHQQRWQELPPYHLSSGSHGQLSRPC